MTSRLASAIADLGLDSLTILDCHGHVGAWHNFRIPQYSADSIVHSMDLLGIRTTFVSALSGMVDEATGDTCIRQAAREHPGRLAPVPIANPNRPAATQRYLQTWAESGGAQMVKVHPTIHDYPVDGPNYRAVFELAADRWLVLSHTWGGSALCHPGQLGQVAREFPDTTFIAAHSGGNPAGCVAAVEAAQAQPNVYLDLAGSLVYDGMLEWMVGRVGADRVLFGTDAAFLDPRPQFGRVALARISVDDKRRILCENLARLLAAIQ
jgi:predicted TIM-barrel fold metal-dependent hydrolase